MAGEQWVVEEVEGEGEAEQTVDLSVQICRDGEKVITNSNAYGVMICTVSLQVVY